MKKIVNNVRLKFGPSFSIQLTNQVIMFCECFYFYFYFYLLKVELAVSCSMFLILLDKFLLDRNVLHELPLPDEDEGSEFVGNWLICVYSMKSILNIFNV